MRAVYKMQWPKEGLFVDAFVHEILNFRYNWHEADYEMNILLSGKAEFSRGGKAYILETNDVLLIDPGVPHASLALEPNTLSLVIHFSVRAFKSYLKTDEGFSFRDCVSTQNIQNNPSFRRLRFYAAGLMQALDETGPYQNLAAKANLEMIIVTLCREFDPQTAIAAPDLDNAQQESIRRITQYLSDHYRAKITLEDLSEFTQYNRTYLSTFLKNHLGMNFYEYLTRVRFQHAAFELAATDKTLTEVAISNGFPDLQTFKARFRETFQKTPAEYRAGIEPGRTAPILDQKIFYPAGHTPVRTKLEEYLTLPVSIG